LGQASTRAIDSESRVGTPVGKMNDGYNSDRFWLGFEDAKGDPGKLEAWQTFITELMATEAWKATGYDTWKLERSDWGWMSASSGFGDILAALAILEKLGFTVSGCPWDITVGRVLAPEMGLFKVRQVIRSIRSVIRSLAPAVTASRRPSK